MERKRKCLASKSNTSTSTTECSTPTKRLRTSFEKRAGTILRMTLKNFMCHSNLDVEFTENVTIVTGRNGSGKSAILTGLVVGLGGKTKSTQRGNSLKELIKSNQTSGGIDIEVYNDGPLAYRPKVYGGKITICRRFTKAGSNVWRIKSESGKVIASRAREVTNIVTALNIQVNNPVCILNQDTSRSFLSANNPHQNYTLFMNATRLNDLFNEYTTINNNRVQATDTLEDKQRNVNVLKTELEKLKKRIDNQVNLVEFQERIRTTNKELFWAKVRDIENEVRLEENKIEKLNQAQEKIVENGKRRVEHLNNIKQINTDLDRQLNELRNRIDLQSRSQMDVVKIVERLRNKFNEKRREKQNVDAVIENRNRDVRVLEKDIAENNEKISKVEEEKLKRQQNISHLNEKLVKLNDHLSTSRNELFQISNNVAKVEEEKQGTQSESLKLDLQITNQKNSLNMLNKESSNTLLLYGRDIPAIRQRIEQYKNRFKELPRGPLGSCVKLKDKKWAVAVEGFIGAKLLKAFLVDNKRDCQILMQIFDEVWHGEKRPMIITGKFVYKKHDVNKNMVKAPRDCQSLFNMLEIDDPIVSNCIVDQVNAEEVLLIPSNERAIQLMSNRQNVPKNCRLGVTVQGDQFYPDPNYKTYASRYHRAQYLQIDVKDHILQLERNLSELNQRKDEFRRQLNQLDVVISEQRGQITQLDELVQKIRTSKMQISKQLELLQASAEPEVVSIDALESELTEIRKIMQEKTAELAALDENMKEIKNEISEQEEKLGQVKDITQELQDRISNLEAQIRENSLKKKEFLAKEEFENREQEETNNKIKQLLLQLDNKKQLLSNHLSDVENMGERHLTRRKIDDIINEIGELKRTVTKLKNRNEDLSELKNKYQSLKQKFFNSVELLEHLQMNIISLNKAIDERKMHYELVEQYFIRYVKYAFENFMTMRHFEGSIEFDKQTKKLELIISPQQGSQGQTNVTNLSGGERSFSTVAFLYSLWQCMDFPFYFLDEFDIFMDKMNRTKVLHLLINHAKSHPDLQFVFLTPQDVSFIDKDVSILRLENPRS